MAELHLLHLDPGGLTDYLPNGRTVSFPPTAEGQRAFATHLRAHIRARFKLLVDLPDEQFTIEALPALRGSDRRRLIARRRRQAESSSPFITVLPLRHLPDEPPGESLLLATLSRPEMLQAWLDVFHTEGITLTGMHSAPFVGMSLLPHLGTSPTSAALVAWRTPAGLRVSYYAGGKLRFSRLTSVGAQAFTQCAQEVQRTRQYLIAQRVLGRDTPLRICALAPVAQHAALQADSASTSFECIDADAIATKLGAISANGADSLPLLLRLVTRGPRVPPIDAPSLRQHKSQYRARYFGTLGAMALTGACLVIGASNLIRLRTLDADITALEHRVADTQTKLDARLAAIPATPLPSASIHTAYARIQALLGATTLDAALHRLARALDRFPVIELTRVDWSAPPNDAPQHPTLRLHLALPATAPPSLNERFIQALRETTHAKVMIERPAIATPTAATDTPTNSTLVVRLDFAAPTP